MSTPSTDLREWLAGQLRRADVPDRLWGDLNEAGLLSEDREESRGAILNEARRRLRAIRQDQGKPRRPRVLRLLTLPEERRAWAFSNCIAQQARDNQEVHEFRNEVFGGRLLSREEAIGFLSSEAPRYLSLSDFSQEEIPLDRRMKAVSNRSSGPAPGSRRQWRLNIELNIGWEGGSKVITRYHDYAADRPSNVMNTMIYLTANGERWLALDAWPGSLFETLAQLSNRLGELYPWLQEQATMFILTGETPFISPLRVDQPRWRSGSYGHAQLTIHVEPWVSTETVARFYRHLQKGSIPKRSRAVSERHLTLLDFVTKHTEPGGDIPTFEVLRERWNSSFPRWKYKSAWRFSRDYRRVGATVVFPPYTPFNPEPERAKERR